MQIKRYEAKNMTTALRMVKEELGSDAVILSARSLRKGSGIFSTGKHLGVAVTAAIDGSRLATGMRGDRAAAAAAGRSHKAIQRYRQPVDRTAKQPDNTAPGDDLVRRPGDQKRSCRPRRNIGIAAGILNALHHQLVNQDIQASIASAIIEEIRRIPGIEGISGPRQIRDYLREMLEEMDIRTCPIGAAGARPKLIAFVGPPGVGKTTTLAKLAARHAAAQLKVALIGMDGYRIGAVQELQTYADIIGVPLAVLHTPAALRATLKRFKQYDVVYLDTAGIGFNERDRLTELQAALAKVKGKQVHLLLSANTRERDLAVTIDRFKPLPVSCLGFTHLDECSTYGVLINMLSQAKLPLSVLSQGQQIPEDLQDGTLDAILDWLLKDFDELNVAFHKPAISAERTASQPLKGPRYVANRNSDVYHEPQCKWTRKIKPENMVEFATIIEAESQRYLPCRTCRPDRSALDQQAASTRDRVTLTSYR